ncbi:MAG TPA: DUF58 domain-containing protein [Steroidobacter sp.]|jgi:uncharacterized protein (DUF58 family)|nr:DUF58 domain-containing protein [Steroidobacter sp.]
MSLRRNALVLAALTALLGILGAWSADPTLAGVWRLPLAVLLLGLAYEGWLVARAQVRLEISSAHSAVLGRAGALQFRFSHRLRRPLPLEFRPGAPPAVEVDDVVRTVCAPASSPGTLEVAAMPRRLGAHPWPDVRTRIAGALGLAWWARALRTEFTLHATPDILRGEVRRLAALAGGVRLCAAVGAGLEVLQLRDYRPGDPLHVIDWKASARANRLVSRDFSEDQRLDIILAIDVGKASAVRAGELDRLGCFANVAARFAEYAVAQDDRVGMVFFADRPLAALAPGRGANAVLRIRRLLETVQASQAESNPLNAALRIRSLALHRTLVVILTDLDDATAAGQLASAARLLAPKHLPLIAGLSSRQIEALAQAPAHSWRDPYEALAAQEYCARLQRNMQALRTLGAAALVAYPDQLEQTVFNCYADLRRRRRV